MTRFTSNALPRYVPEPYQSPMAGLWNMISAWYSTSPEFRNSLADLFTSETEPESGYEQSFDTTMTYPQLDGVPEFESAGTKSDVNKILVGTDVNDTNIGWLRDIGRDVRDSNDYDGLSIRRKLISGIPTLKKPEGW